MELDHIVVAVRDTKTAARAVEERYGLTSIEGGRHSGWGTANRIVPLGDSYIELVAVVDEAEAARSVFGKWVARERYTGLHPLGWAVRSHDLDQVAARLGLTIVAGSRAAGGGELLRWRLAGIEQAAAQPSLPFFIEWGQGTPFPGRIQVAHRAGLARIQKLKLRGDANRLSDWLGVHSLPVEVWPASSPGVTSVVLTTGTDEMVLEGHEL